MTLKDFEKLVLDHKIGESKFNAFLDKFRNTFTTIIRIHYSDERYECVDIEKIFYQDFKPFVILQLQSTNDAISLANWAPILAKKRAEQIRPSVDKQLIAILLQNGGVENWNLLNNLLPTVFSNEINRIVYRAYNKDKYKGLHRDIKQSLLTMFYLQKMTPSNDDDQTSTAGPNAISKEIQNIDAYIYTMLYNFAINSTTRKNIDIELGVDHDDENPDSGDISDDNPVNWDESIDKRNDDAKEGDENNLSPIVPLNTPHLNDQQDNIYFDDNDSDKLALNEIAKKDLEVIFGLIPKKVDPVTNQVVENRLISILRFLMIHDYDRAQVAEMLNCTIEELNRDAHRAMVLLIRYALPYIQKKSRSFYARHRSLLEDCYDKEILDLFFIQGKNVESIALIYNEKPKRIGTILAEAYNGVKNRFSKNPLKKTIKTEETPTDAADSRLGKIYSTDNLIQAHNEGNKEEPVPLETKTNRSPKMYYTTDKQINKYIENENLIEAKKSTRKPQQEYKNKKNN